MIQGGYTQKLLRIDLTNQTFAEEIIPEKIIRDYMGGAGVALKYLFDEVDGAIDPLSVENKLILSDGPLTGTSAACASRMSIVAKSPLTGAVSKFTESLFVSCGKYGTIKTDGIKYQGK